MQSKKAPSGRTAHIARIAPTSDSAVPSEDIFLPKHSKEAIQLVDGRGHFREALGGGAEVNT